MRVDGRGMTMASKRKRLGEMLIEAKLITEAQLRGALGRQKKWGGRLGANLIKLGNISEQDLLRFLATQTGVKEMDILNIPILPHILKLVPEKVADKYTVIPIAMQGPHTLMVACADPTDLAALDHLSFVTGHKMGTIEIGRNVTGHKIEPVLATHSEITAAIDKHYRGGRSRAGEISVQSDDEDMTVDLSPLAGHGGELSDKDPDLIIFNKSHDKGQVRSPDTPRRPAPAKQGSRNMGPPPNMPDPFHPTNMARSPMGDDEFTLDFTPDWGAPTSRANPRNQDADPSAQAPQPRSAQRQQGAAGRQPTLEQKMRALYNVLIRKGLVKEAEIQQELMRLWSLGKL